MTKNGEIFGILPAEKMTQGLHNNMHELQSAAFTLDENYCISSWSMGAEKKLGYSIDEAVGKELQELFQFSNALPGSGAAGYRISERSVTVLELFSTKFPLTHIGLKVSVTPISIAHNKPAGYVCVVSDKETAANEISSVAYLKNMIAASHDAIIATNTDDIIVIWNKGAVNLYGYTEEETIGRPISMIVPPNSRAERGVLIEAIKKSGGSKQFETEILKKDGNLLPVSLSLSAIKNSEGNIIGISGISRDITEQHTAARLLQMSYDEKQALAERVSAILDTLPANVALINKNGLIVDVNYAWKHFTIQNCFQGAAYSVGKNYVELAAHLSERNKEIGLKIAEGVKQVLNNQSEKFVLEYPCLYDEIERWYRIVVSPLHNDELEGAVIMHNDITQLKKLYEDKVHEQQRVSQLILQAQEKERDQMGREIHDNLGQLLAAFKMLLVHAIKNPPIDVAYLEDLTHHIEAALAETRCLSHRMVTPRFAVLRLHEALQNLADNYTNANRKVIVTYEYTTTHLITQEIKQSLYRIAQEALNNIEKYAHASYVRVFLQIRDDQVRLEIEDNGIGFDSNKAANGIGITNMINRASSFDGSVKIISAPGQGCLIAVVIPLLIAHAENG